MPRTRAGPAAPRPYGRPVVGCGAEQQGSSDVSSSAEVAFTVADELHRHGIGMLLLYHMVSLAQGRGFRAFIS